VSISSLRKPWGSRVVDFQLKLFEAEKLERVNVEGMRHYKTPDGVFPSVTTVLSNLDKSSLDNWKKLVGQQEADRVKNRSATRGSELHKVVEDYMLNRPSEVVFSHSAMPLTRIMFKAIQPILDEVEVVFGIETPLYSKDLKTAGTTDQLCIFRGKNTVIDLKTSGKLKKEQHLKSYYYQSTAYAMMAESLFGINIDQIVLLIALEHEGKQVVVEDSHKYRAEVKEFFEKYSM
jgi:CRISPR/Cas system-associated exonuclease Cas4 (RecB family)